MTKEKLSDLWSTPDWLFDKLNKEFDFRLDLCASSFNSKCGRSYADNYLETDCSYFKINSFINPPYSMVFPFVKKAWDDSKSFLIVGLLKVDPSTKWWSIFWDYETHQPKTGCKVRFLNKRVKFDPPPGEVLEDYLENGSDKDKKLAKSLIEGKITTPAFPSAVVVFDRRFVEA